MQTLITDERGAGEALKGVVIGSKLRIAFKSDAGDKVYQRLACLRHKLEFSFEWLVLVNNCVATTGRWEGIPRTQDFTVTRMSASDREIIAHTLSDIAESIEIV